MNKKILAIICLATTSAYAQNNQNDSAYWCKYLDNCNQTEHKSSNVPQQDPYSTPVYNDGGPSGLVNGEPYYNPYNTPSDEVEMPYYGGGEIIGTGSYPIQNNYSNGQNSGSFNIKERN